MGFSARHIIGVDAGGPTVVLAGLHVGCYELFGDDRLRSVRDLKGKTVAVTGLGTGRHVFFAAIAAYVGLDPRIVEETADELVVVTIYKTSQIDKYVKGRAP